MPSFTTTALTLALGLAGLTSATGTLESRQAMNVKPNWKIDNKLIGCGANTCNYSFDINAEEYRATPGFNVKCESVVPLKYGQYIQCNLNGATSSIVPGRAVTMVWAAVSMDPSEAQQSYVYAYLTFQNEM